MTQNTILQHAELIQTCSSHADPKYKLVVVSIHSCCKASERGKKTRQTEEEVGRQHQGMDDLEFGKSQRAEENRGKWRELDAKLSVVPQRVS